MGQGGNVWEWNETAYDGSNNTAGENRDIRGASWYYGREAMVASYRGDDSPMGESHDIGFRVAAVGVPEPSALSLLAIGLSGLALVRRRKQS